MTATMVIKLRKSVEPCICVTLDRNFLGLGWFRFDSTSGSQMSLVIKSDRVGDVGLDLGAFLFYYYHYLLLLLFPILFLLIGRTCDHHHHRLRHLFLTCYAVKYI